MCVPPRREKIPRPRHFTRAVNYYDAVVQAQAVTEVQVRPWRILSGLAISGFLLALPGGLLPLWGYHIRPDFAWAANYFAILGLGLTGGSGLALRLRQRYALERLLAAGCFAGALALLLLSLAAPPARYWFQSIALLVTGAAAGIINTAIFESLAAAWEANPAGITLRGGAVFGGGSVIAAWLLSDCLAEGGAPRFLSLAAMAPAAAGVLLGRLPLRQQARRSLPVAETVRDMRSVLAIFFALLLFFEFANEWSIAGWLPVFLIDRLGISPETAVMYLAIYWLALTAGRLGTARLLARVRHWRLLGLSAFCALSGCTLLLSAATQAGAVLGILLIGAGFSAIYPLSAERIRTRFSYYHPGYFNGIFTFAMLGGSLAPFVLGHVAGAYGLRVIPAAAMAGSCAVFALVLLIWLGRKVSGS